MIRVVPRSNVLDPCQVIRFHAPGKTDRVLYADMSEVINRKRNIHPNGFTHLPDILLKHIQSLFGQPDPGERMRHRIDLVSFMAHLRVIHRTMGRIDGMLCISLHFIQEAERCRERSRLIDQQSDAKIHFQEGKAHLHPFFQRLAHIITVVLSFDVSIAVDADPVTEFSAKQLPAGNSPGLSRNVPQSHFHAGYTTALTGMEPELLDPAEKLIYVERVFAENPALKHGSIGFGRSITHFPIAYNAGIRIDLDQRAAFGHRIDIAETHISDLELGTLLCR